MDALRSGIGFPRPDFVICGTPAPGDTGWVRLIASKELTQAELEYQAGRGMAEYESLTPEWGPMLVQRLTLRVEMDMGKPKAVILIDAPDYPTAFRELFKDWAPGPAERLALGGQRGITA